MDEKEYDGLFLMILAGLVMALLGHLVVTGILLFGGFGGGPEKTWYLPQIIAGFALLIYLSALCRWGSKRDRTVVAKSIFLWAVTMLIISVLLSIIGVVTACSPQAEDREPLIVLYTLNIVFSVLFYTFVEQPCLGPNLEEYQEIESTPEVQEEGSTLGFGPETKTEAETQSAPELGAGGPMNTVD